MLRKLLILLIFIGCFANTYAQQVPLHIYGGKNHDVYLGCLNCGRYDNTSIWNAYGTHGSKYNSNSIWNKYGTYGGLYNTYSPFNPYSTSPPVIVDKKGNFYGYFTSNAYMEKRVTSQLALVIIANWDEIADDVAAWYDKIFG